MNKGFLANVVGLVALLGACSEEADAPHHQITAGQGGEGGAMADQGAGGITEEGGLASGADGSGHAQTDDGGQGGAAGEGGVIAGGGSAGDGASSNGGGAAGDGATDPGNTAPHWLSFNHYQGAFVYDVSSYPEESALFKLTSKSPGTQFGIGPWSPDGRSVLYWDAIDLYCRDMTSAEPGPALLMVQAPADRANSAANVARLSWSGDSRSAALATGSSLAIFDPRQANPTLHTLTPSIRAAEWAPSGKWLFYRDDDGFHVVDVDAGQPGISQPLDISVFKGWSPDGKLIAATSGLDLTLTDVSQETLVTTKVTTPAVAQPFVSTVRFSPSGRSLVFIGAQTRAVADLYYLPLNPLSSPEPITGKTADAPGASSILFWSPDDRWLGFRPSGANAQSQALDLSKGESAIPFVIKPQSNSPFSWLTKTPNTFVSWLNSPNVHFATYDLSTPDVDPVVVLLSASTGHALSPVGDILAANDVDAVAMRDLHAPPPPADIRVRLASSTNQLRWSPDGRFLSIIAEDGGYRQEIIDVNGSTPSKPFPIGPGSPSNIVTSWQPVFR